MGNPRWLVNTCFVLVCFCNLVFSQVAYSAVKKPVVRPASAQDTFVKGGQTLDIDRHWGEVIDVKPQSINLPVEQKSKYSMGRFKGIVANALKLHPGRYLATAAGSALLVAMPDADWDGFKLQKKTPGVPVDPVTYKWVAGGNGMTAQATSPLAAFEDIASRFCWDPWENCTVINYVRQSPVLASAVVRRNYKGVPSNIQEWTFNASAQGNCPTGYTVIADGSCRSNDPQVTPFSDGDFSQLANGVDSLGASDISSLGQMTFEDVPGSYDYPDSETFDGPTSMSGQPQTTTTSKTNPDGSKTVDLSETTTNYNFEYSTNPLAVTTTTTTTVNNYSNGTLVSTSTSTDASANPQEQPKEKIDCEFMPTHCSWIEWTKDGGDLPETTDLPTEEIEKPDGVTVNVSAACPAPIVIDGGGIQGWTTFSIKFDVACDFLSTISPIVKGVCMMIAALILVWKP